jgi:hypothetical protein
MGAGDQALLLDFRHAGDDHNTIAEQFTFGFIKERDIGQEKFAGLAAFLRRSGPLPADARMEDLLERALLFRVDEDYRPKCRPIQIAARRKNRVAKFLSQKPAHLRVRIGQLPRGAIGIEEPRARSLMKEAGESGFAGGNATGDPNDGAGFEHGEVSRLYPKGEGGATRSSFIKEKASVAAKERKIHRRRRGAGEKRAIASSRPKHRRRGALQSCAGSYGTTVRVRLFPSPLPPP